jgi:S1-C subfamily serine protease
VPLGTSRDLQVGQKVYAIGNPFGLDQSLTTGIISALGREIESVTRRPIKGAIQTDAAINPGNSGGPLLDSAGRLIGVNTAIYSPSGASAGIGFAIPVDEVNRIVPRLIRDGRMVRPALGVSTAPPEWNRAGPAQGRGHRAGAAAGAGRRPASSPSAAAKAAWCRAMSSPPSTASRWPRWTTCSPPWKSCSRAICTVTLWRAGQTRQQRVTLAASED